MARKNVNERFSFIRGWNQVPNKDMKKVRSEICKGLNISTRTSWGNRLNGLVEPKVSEYELIESVFRKVGITNVWGV